MPPQITSRKKGPAAEIEKPSRKNEALRRWRETSSQASKRNENPTQKMKNISS
jgi:hypothetical protein